MKRTLRVTPEAHNDLRSAYRWYEAQRLGLGRRFNERVDAAMVSALESPKQHAVVHEEVRRVLVRRFPYGVFFTDEPAGIVVLAVLHLRRDPDLLRARLEP